MSVKELLQTLEASQQAAEEYDDLFIPLSLRLERDSYAFLIQLAKKYNYQKATMAADLLQDALGQAMGCLGMDEATKMIREGTKELESKKKNSKSKHRRKGK